MGDRFLSTCSVCCAQVNDEPFDQATHRTWHRRNGDDAPQFEQSWQVR